MTEPDVITGARPYGEGEPVDVLVARRRGRRDRGRASRRRRARPSTPTGSSCCPASSTCTPTCASPAARSPRRSPPARPPPRSAASPRCSRCPTPTRWPTPPSSSSTCAAAAREVGLVDVHPVGAVTVGLRGRADGRARHDGPLARAGCGCSPTTAGACTTRSIMRRALEYASALDAVDRPARRGPPAHRGRAGARGRRRVAARAGRAGPPTAEETIVARDCALAREAGARLHVCHVSRRAHGRRAAGGQGGRRAGHRRGHAAPPAAHRRARCPATTRCTRSTRRCAPAPTPRRCAPRSPRA